MQLSQTRNVSPFGPYPLSVLVVACGVIGAGVITGGSISWARALPVQLAGMSSILILIAATFVHRNWTVFGFLVYAVLLVYADPLMRVFMFRDMIIGPT